MFKKHKLDTFPNKFPQDKEGHVPTHVDCWREMQFDHEDDDPNEEGISAEEKQRRIKHLDEVWWPRVLEKVAEEHQRLTDEHGESFIEYWQRVVNETPNPPHGFEV